MLSNIQQANSGTPQIQIPFAIAKLGESARIIRQAISELPNLRRRLERNKGVKTRAREIYIDMQNHQNRLINAFNIAALSLLEAEQDELANHSVMLGQSIKTFNLMTPDYTKLCTVFEEYLSGLPIEEQHDSGTLTDFTTDGTDTSTKAQTTNSHIIARLMNNVRMGYYPTCTDNLAHIIRGMNFPEGITLNMIDPCCGCGLALRFLSEGASDNGINSKTYGIELDKYRAEEALTRIDRVGFGSYFHSRISNEAFHIMLLNPPYMSVMTEGGNNTRSEKSFLVDSVSNLMMGGLLIYIIPYYRLTADIAKMLSDNFSDISVWKFTASEFKKFNQIAVLGTRRKRLDGSDMVSSITSLVLEPDKLPEITELATARYQLPNIAKDVALFKGALFNESELAEQLRNSKGFSRLYQRSGLDGINKRPLLPLNISQIGLVGGSGLINGNVECDYSHIIKGRIVKVTHSFENEKTDKNGELIHTTITKTTSNKLIFNLLTPGGFISLTDYGSSDAVISYDDGSSEDTDSRLGNFNSGGNEASLDADNTLDTNRNILFPLGRTVITREAREVLNDNDIQTALQRHESGDWGNVPKQDWSSNNKAVKNGERIFSSYLSFDEVKFWIITEWDRSYTTVMLPTEY